MRCIILINFSTSLKDIYDRARIIIIIKQGWKCKAGRERLTPYQFKDPNPATPTHRMKEEKVKTAGDILASPVKIYCLGLFIG